MSRTRRSTAFSKEVLNRIQIKLPALSVNEGMARAAVAAFIAQLDPGVTEVADVKCAVSEAITNCIVHAYGGRGGEIYITVTLYCDRSVRIDIRDKGCGIADVALAMQPLFTTDRSGERSGMGFPVMQTFMDTLSVRSRVGVGTKLVMRKKLSA